MILVQHNVSITNKEHFEQSSSRAGKSSLSADPEPVKVPYQRIRGRTNLNIRLRSADLYKTISSANPTQPRQNQCAEILSWRH